MTSHTGSRWCRRFAGVGLPLPVLLLVSPATAPAGCRDYGFFVSPPPHPGQRETVPGPRGRASGPAAPQPCSGPGCNRGTPLPLPAPTTLRSLQAEEWPCLSDGLLLTNSPLATLLVDQP